MTTLVFLYHRFFFCLFVLMWFFFFSGVLSCFNYSILETTYLFWHELQWHKVFTDAAQCQNKSFYMTNHTTFILLFTCTNLSVNLYILCCSGIILTDRSLFLLKCLYVVRCNPYVYSWWQAQIWQVLCVLRLSLFVVPMTPLSYNERHMFCTTEQRITVLFAHFRLKHILKHNISDCFIAWNRFPNLITFKKS